MPSCCGPGCAGRTPAMGTGRAAPMRTDEQLSGHVLMVMECCPGTLTKNGGGGRCVRNPGNSPLEGNHGGNTDVGNLVVAPIPACALSLHRLCDSGLAGKYCPSTSICSEILPAKSGAVYAKIVKKLLSGSRINRFVSCIGREYACTCPHPACTGKAMTGFSTSWVQSGSESPVLRIF